MSVKCEMGECARAHMPHRMYDELTYFHFFFSLSMCSRENRYDKCHIPPYNNGICTALEISRLFLCVLFPIGNVRSLSIIEIFARRRG